MTSNREFQIDHVHVWMDPGGGITIKAVAGQDPVELSSTQASRLASALIELADLDEA
jgi:hypothetical protein